MNNNDSLIQIDAKLIDKLVMEHIQVAVAQALSKDKDVLVNKLIETVIRSKVDSNGVQQSHDRYNTTTWLDWAIANELRAAVLVVIQEQIVAMKPDIVESVKKQFSRSQSEFAKAVVEGMTSSLK